MTRTEAIQEALADFLLDRAEHKLNSLKYEIKEAQNIIRGKKLGYMQKDELKELQLEATQNLKLYRAERDKLKRIVKALRQP